MREASREREHPKPRAHGKRNLTNLGTPKKVGYVCGHGAVWEETAGRGRMVKQGMWTSSEELRRVHGKQGRWVGDADDTIWPC